MIATSNLALRFVLELAGLGTLAHLGLQSLDGTVCKLAAIAAPLALALFLALVVAPKGDKATAAEESR